jgi:hypothetical protein
MEALLKNYFDNEVKEEKEDYKELYSTRVFKELEIEV